MQKDLHKCKKKSKLKLKYAIFNALDKNVMFSGIIEETQELKSVLKKTDDLIIEIKPSFNSDCILGQSIAVQGICLTVAEIKESLFFYLSPETISKTNSQYWQPGQIVNLERSLKVSDRLDGHLVSGHVDGTLTVIDIIPHGEAFKVVFKLASHEELRLIYPKGSIAIDGISLTINDIQDDRFSVMIIPHTWTHTNAQFWQCGQKVHVEFDSMAKMIDHQLRIREKNGD